MTLALDVDIAQDWRPACRVDELLAGRGVCALFGGQQVAIFLLWDGTVRAVGNYDPYGRAYVISRGIVGSRGDTPTVASPLYKNIFDLTTGRPVDDPDGLALPTYATRVADGTLEVRLR